MPRVEKDVERRFEQGYLHDLRSEGLVKTLTEIDNKNKLKNYYVDAEDKDYILSLLDIYFEMKDITSTD